MTVTIIGKGRVGQALAARSAAAGQACHLLGRDGGGDLIGPKSAAGQPIVVATRNDDLGDVVARVDRSRHADLVFVQNGMLRPWLAEHGLSGVTRGLLFFAVAGRGDPVSPGGESPFWGPHAEALAAWFRGMQLEAAAVSREVFAAQELEKLLWNCIFGLLCEVHDAAVGEVVRAHRADVDALTRELSARGAAALEIEVDPEAMSRRLCAYSDSIPDYRGAVKELRWRNGWFVELADAPGLHERLLERAGHA